MDWKVIYRDYKELVLLLAGAVITIFVQKILPGFGNLVWKAVSRPFIAGHGMFIRYRSESKFEDTYRQALFEEHRYLKVRGVRTRSPVSVELKDVYVSLSVRRPARPEIETTDTIRSQQQTARMLRVPRARIKDRPIERLSIFDMLKQPRRRLIILGGPGSGKTTLLTYTTLLFARDEARKTLGIDDKSLPLLIPLQKLFRAKAALSAETLPSVCIPPELVQQCPPDFFRKRLLNGSCVILLDGVDEVTTDDDRRRLMEEIETFVSMYPDNRYIVTSRPAAFEGLSLGGFTQMDICDFTDDDVQAFARQWCQAIELADRQVDSEIARAVASREANQNAEDLINAVKSNERVRNLTVNPLLMTIVATVHRYRAELPRRRVELYDECVEVLLGHWDRAKGIAGKLDSAQKRRVLEPVAYALHSQGLRELEADSVGRLIGVALPLIGEQSLAAREFLSEVRERSGLLVERSLGIYGFSHLTFQEYLTARHLIDQGAEGINVILRHIHDPWWIEVILLFAGMRDATPLLTSILELPENLFHDNLMFAARCLGEAVTTDPALEKHLVSALVVESLEAPFQGLRRRASLALAALGTTSRKNAVSEMLSTHLLNSDAPTLAEGLSMIARFMPQKHEFADVAVEYLSHSSAEVRSAALGVLELWETPQPALLEGVRNLLDDAQFEIKIAAALRLSTWGFSDNLVHSILLDSLETEDVEWEVIEVLGALSRHQDMYEILISTVLSGRSPARGRALQALRFSNENTTEVIQLAKQFFEDQDSEMRIAAVMMFYHQASDHSEAMDMLFTCLSSPDEEVVELAAFGVAREIARVPALVARVADKLQTLGPMQAVRAIQGMAYVGVPPVLVQQVVRLATHPDGAVRRGAVDVARFFGSQDDDVVLALKDALVDSDCGVNVVAADSLTRLVGPDAQVVGILLDHLAHEDASIRSFAADGLAQCAGYSPTVDEALLRVFFEQSEEPRDAVSYAVHRIIRESPEALAKLLHGLHSPEMAELDGLAVAVMMRTANDEFRYDASPEMLKQLHALLSDNRVVGDVRVQDLAWELLFQLGATHHSVI